MKNFIYFITSEQTNDELFKNFNIENIKKNKIKTSVIGQGPGGHKGTMFTLKDSESDVFKYDKEKQTFEKVFEKDNIKLYIGYWNEEYESISLDDLLKKDISITSNEVELLNNKVYKIPSILSIPFSFNYVDGELAQVPSKKYKYLNEIAFKYDEYAGNNSEITITYKELFDDSINLLKCFYNTNEYEVFALQILDTEVISNIIKSFMEFDKRSKLWEEYLNKQETEKKT